MSFAATLVGGFKSLSEISKTLSEINKSLVYLGDVRTDAKINNIKNKLDEIEARVKNEEDRNRLLDLAKQLTSARM